MLLRQEYLKIDDLENLATAIKPKSTSKLENEIRINKEIKEKKKLKVCIVNLFKQRV